MGGGVIVCTKPLRNHRGRWLVSGLGSPAWAVPAAWGLRAAASVIADSVLSLRIQMCEVCE